MTEAEALETAAAFSANALTSFTVYISFTFAYLTAGYVAAVNFTKFQLLVGSGLFVASAGSAGVSCVASSDAMMTILTSYPSVLDNQISWSIPWAAVMSVVLSAGLLISLYFVYDLRRRA